MHEVLSLALSTIHFTMNNGGCSCDATYESAGCSLAYNMPIGCPAIASIPLLSLMLHGGHFVICCMCTHRALQSHPLDELESELGSPCSPLPACEGVSLAVTRRSMCSRMTCIAGREIGISYAYLRPCIPIWALLVCP